MSGQASSKRSGPDEPGAALGGGNDIAVIRDQTRETLELLRALIQLLMPKDGARDGPSLEEMISALLVQGRETVLAIQALREDVNTLLDRTESEPSELNGRHGPNGGARA